MHFSQLFTVLALGLTATGFLIPEGQEDGTYVVQIINGHSVHTKIRNATEYPPSAPPYVDVGPSKSKRTPGHPHLAKREGVSCDSGPRLNAANTDDANRDMDYQCRNKPVVQPGYSYYSIRGEVVGYFCAFDGASTCDPAQRSEYMKRITNVCGSYWPGWYTYYNNRWSHGYQRGRCFCGQCV